VFVNFIAGLRLPDQAQGCCGVADLKKLGGLEALTGALKEGRGSAVNAAAAHCIGTAASNNHVFQEDLMESFPGVVTRLLQASRPRVA
jgi:hypothetical protein